MSNESIEENLRSLTPNELTVLKLKCQDLKYAAIAERLGYSVEWVQFQMSSAYKKLGFSKDMHHTQRKKILEDEICPKLEEIKEETTEEPVPEPEPEMLALVLYDDQDGGDNWDETGIQEVPPAIVIPPPPRRRRLWGLLILVLLGCLGIGVGGYLLGRGNIPIPFLDTATPTITYTPTLTPTFTPTETFTPTLTPTDTLTPTETLTPTPTQTQTPTETQSPLGLTVGDSLSDNRVTLKLQLLKYEQGRTRIGHKPLAPIIYDFVFTNHSGDTILLEITPDKFYAEDNLGNKLTCDFWNGIVETTESFAVIGHIRYKTGTLFLI